MPSSDRHLIVSTGWLAERLTGPDIRVLDASWHMPDTGRNAQAEYAGAHIPGARFFDIDAVADRKSTLPHMLPPVEQFVSAVRKLGIGDGHQVVVYDQTGLFSAARGLVDVPGLRTCGCRRARWRVAQVDRGGAPDGGSSTRAARSALHGHTRCVAGARCHADGRARETSGRSDRGCPLAGTVPR